MYKNANENNRDGLDSKLYPFGYLAQIPKRMQVRVLSVAISLICFLKNSIETLSVVYIKNQVIKTKHFFFLNQQQNLND